MNVPAGLAVGVATHTGVVRAVNEDDYLLGVCGGPSPQLLAAVADGMGGAVGGAEASRAALRALGTVVLDPASQGAPAARLLAGFQAAMARVAEQAREVPALRGMGTTLTAVMVGDGQVQIGHVGDTRAYLWRAGSVTQLTTDHAVREPDNVLTRCIGGGRASAEVDAATVAVAPGDRLLLVSDGVWSVVPEGELAALAGPAAPQAAAEALVGRALAAGAPDNATAVVVAFGHPAPGWRAAPLPREERPRLQWPPAASLRAPWWPWVVLVAAAVVLVVVTLRWLGWADGVGWLRSWW